MQNGGMVELVDAASLNGAAFGREGSSPSATTVLVRLPSNLPNKIKEGVSELPSKQ